MAHNYIIAIGGTGARCLEAFIYLAASGLARNISFKLLMIDADQNNGNGSKTNQLIELYNEIHQLTQPMNPSRKRNRFAEILGKQPLPPPTLFQSQFNHGRVTDTRWQNPNDSNLQFKHLIQYSDQPEEMRAFLDLFYSPSDLDLILKEGYIGKPNIGSVALKQSLERSIVSDSSLYNYLQRLNSDLQGDEVRIFVFGSVFGGTGAAGLPTIPALINNLPENGVVSKENRERLRYGCTMIAPYFSFPRDENNSADSPGTDSAKHAIATQAALIHYAQTPSNYQHIYFIGAPSRLLTNEKNVRGGEEQNNSSHYVELVAALAALDFFSLRNIESNAQKLHFADTISVQSQEDMGINWETLPLSPLRAHERNLIKESLLTFSTFAYLYRNLLYQRFINNHEYKTANWYGHNFAQLSLDNQTHELGLLYRFTNSYLNWLRETGATCQPANEQPRLFNWNAFADGYNDDTHRLNLGSLLASIGASPRYANEGWDRIMDKLNGIKLEQPKTRSATGLFIYLLHAAVAEYCRENYQLQS